MAESKEEIKRELGIPFAKTVLFMGNMAADNGRKRVDHLIEIFRNLPRKDVGLVLAGPGMSQDLQLRLNARNTRYFGNVQDPEDRQISRLCKMADLCAIPGHVGLGLNQAFYWGLPVITQEGHHPPEIAYLKPGRNGFIVPSGALAAFEERMLEVLDHDELRAQLSRNAAVDIRKEASPEIMFQGFHQCVRGLRESKTIGATKRVEIMLKADSERKPNHIAVCVCTYKRPQMLQRLLDDLSVQETGGAFEFSIVVMDNDPSRSAEPVVSAFSTQVDGSGDLRRGTAAGYLPRPKSSD